MNDMRNIATWSLLTLIAVFLAGCANMQTIDRITRIPSDERIAVHLDAQQRVILSNDKGFCAEPSPDALSAYAASLALGITLPSEEEQVAVTKKQESSADGIGLRTQSITLMRDAFYRICEAYNNNKLEKWEVAASLARSLDLTAVLLAIEQLTATVKKGKNVGRTDRSDSGPVLTDKIAKSVEAMVIRTLRKNYTTEKCFSYFSSEMTKNPILEKICMRHLDAELRQPADSQ